jgi:hypothetical protein
MAARHGSLIGTARVKVWGASTSRPGARKAHGTAGPAWSPCTAKSRLAGLDQAAVHGDPAGPTAVLKQPSSRSATSQTLGRRNIVPVRSTEARPCLPVTSLYTGLSLRQQHSPTPASDSGPRLVTQALVSVCHSRRAADLAKPGLGGAPATAPRAEPMRADARERQRRQVSCEDGDRSNRSAAEVRGQP